MEQDTQLILDARDNEEALELLIEKDKSFIKATACKVVGRFISESDDEWSVALIAYNEALKSYNETKGAFYPFAALVIKRRLLDLINSQEKYKNEILQEPLAMGGDLDGDSDPTSIQMEIRSKNVELSNSADQSLNNPIKDEIESLQQVLEDYDFSFMDLVKCSPKAQKTKKSCALIITTIIDDDKLLSKLKKSKSLPTAELMEITGLHRKLFEHHRKYIIAAVEILSGEYPLLSEYMKSIKDKPPVQ
ncbi:MAG: RNA polymerase subunit sigma [Butyrivibrio sp.]|nr:RNA polymerase subunit sigma [Butyrivibrio sp.]